MEIQAKEDMDMQKKWWHDKVAYQILRYKRRWDR